MKKIKELITSCREVLAYLFFGVCTTLVTGTTAGTVTAWILSVLFAYVTNRRWVFESRADSAIGIVREGLSFFSCRLATGILDLTVMVFFVELLHQNDMLIKILSNVLVIILNYLASKLFIFQREA